MSDYTDPIKAEAESIVETYNAAKPDHAPSLSWFGMTALRDDGDVHEAFVFDVDGYLDRDGWQAVRRHGRQIESAEARNRVDNQHENLGAELSIIVAVEGMPIPEPQREVCR